MDIEKIEFGNIPSFSFDEKLDMIRSLIIEKPCEVVFMKIDGTIRKMVCTLRPDLIPKDFVPKGEGTQRPPRESGVLSVYLTEERAWRSFRINNVISIEVKDAA